MIHAPSTALPRLGREAARETLRALFDIEIIGLGIVLKGCSLHDKAGKRWVGFPRRSYTKNDGTTAWANIVEFVDNAAKYRASDELLAADASD